MLPASLNPPADRPSSQGNATGAVAEGDLRPATILFADIRGFTSLSEVLSPERLVGAMNGCFELLDQVIGDHGGEIDKFLGDAVMAVFGARTAHVDDPRRAVLAALDMQRALSHYNATLRQQIGCELDMRIGINTGVVLAGPIGSHRKRAFTVMGDAVEIAARLEHAAPVGSILVGETTHMALGRSLRLRLRSSLQMPGMDAPVRCYVVLGQPRRAFSRRGHERYLGGETDLMRISRALASVDRGREAVFEVEGGMGSGKTALIRAVRRSAAGRGRGWLNVACPPYGQDLPYTTLAALVRGLLQRLTPSGGPEAILSSSPNLAGLDVGLAAAVVRDLLADGTDGTDGNDERVNALPAQLRKGLLARVTKELLLAASSRRPIVIVLDDCQWLDAASGVIVEEAMADLRASPVAWLLAHRPGWTAPGNWPIDGRIVIQPLELGSSRLLTRALLGDAVAPALVDDIAERAEGNPLSLVELCMMAEAGFASNQRDAGGTPDTGRVADYLPRLILSRIDSLDEGARRATQVAAVLGHAFPATLMRRVLGRGDWGAVLGRLEEQAILRRESRVRGDGLGTTWIWHFRHALIQETVYASLLPNTRTTLHRVAGDALEHMTDEAVPDRRALLALHFSRSDDRGRAVTYLCLAGDRARTLFLNREAIRYYQDALGRLGNTGSEAARRAEVLASLGTALEALGEDAAAVDSLQAAADLESRAAVKVDLWRRIAELSRRGGHAGYAAAHDALNRAEHLLDGASEPVLLARLRLSRAMLALERGADAEARALGSEALALLEDRSAVALERAQAYQGIALAAVAAEELPVAREAFERALEQSRAANDVLLEATLSLDLGAVLHLVGRLQDATQLYHQALVLHARIGAKRGVALASRKLGDLCWNGGAGDLEVALPHWQRSLRVCEEIGDQPGLATTLFTLGEAQLERGHVILAEELLDRARAMAAELDDDQRGDAVKQATKPPAAAGLTS